MPKHKSSSKGYTSKGQRPNVRKDIRKAIRRDYVGSSEQLYNKLLASKKGKKVMITLQFQILINIILKHDLFVFLIMLLYRMRYVMHRDDLQKLNPLVPVDAIEWANDQFYERM